MASVRWAGGGEAEGTAEGTPEGGQQRVSFDWADATTAASSSGIRPLPEGSLRERLLESGGEYPEEGCVAHTGSACVPSTVATLAIGVLGTGQLALPYAVSLMGLGPGMISLAIMGVFAVVTLYMLSTCKAAVQGEDYGDMLRKMLGQRAAKTADILLGLYAWGGGVTYMMILAKELKMVVSHVAGSAVSRWSEAYFLYFATALVIFPLSSFRKLDRLKFTSTLGATGAVYITLVVTANALGLIGSDVSDISPCSSAAPEAGNNTSLDGTMLSTRGGPTSFQLWPTFEGMSTFRVIFNLTTGFAIFGFALNSAWCFVPVLNNLKHPTSSRCGAVIVSSQALILLNYFLISSSGYFAFCSTTQEDILQNLPNTIPVLVARTLLVVQLCCGLPLRFSVTRGILLKYLAGDAAGSGRWAHQSQLTHITVTTAIVGSSMGTAVAANSISLVMSLVSTVCASAISYVFPSLSYLQLIVRGDESSLSSEAFRLHAVAAGTVLSYGCLMMVGGTIINVIGAAKGYSILGG